MKKTISILFGIVLLSLALRFYFLYSFSILETTEADAVSRLAQANSWVQSQNLFSIPSMIWPSGHHYLLGIPILLGFDLIVGGEALTIILSLLSLFLYYYVLREFFDESSSLASTFLLAILPLGVQLSVLPLSEMPYIFFILLSFALLLKQRSIVYLVLSSLACLCATWIRFEAWFFALFAFPLFLYFETRDFKKTLLLFWANCLGPGIYVFFSYKSSSMFFYGLDSTNKFVSLYDQSKLLSTLGNFKLLILDYTFIFLFALISFVPLGARRMIKNNKTRFYFVIFFILELYLIYETARHHIGFFPRYYFFASIMLFPFVFCAFPSKIRPWATGIICGLIFLHSLVLLPEKIRTTTDYELKNSGVFQMAAWVQKNLPKDEKIIYDGSHWAGASFLLASSRLEKNTILISSVIVKHPEATTEEDYFQLIQKQLEADRAIRYIVYSRKASVEKIGILHNKAIWEKLKKFYEIKELVHYGDFSLAKVVLFEYQ